MDDGICFGGVLDQRMRTPGCFFYADGGTIHGPVHIVALVSFSPDCWIMDDPCAAR